MMHTLFQTRKQHTKIEEEYKKYKDQTYTKYVIFVTNQIEILITTNYC